MTANDEETKDENQKEVSRSDKTAIAILFILYTLQGIPFGLYLSVQLLLQRKIISYKEQAMFSIVNWPYCMKILWAPFVDSIYWKFMGRRKTWLISTQYIIGIFMLLLSSRVSFLFGDVNVPPNVFYLTAAFFILIFLCATQDIALDGWSLTLLSRRNVRFSSVCQSAGLKAGHFFGNVVFLIFESPEFCNQYVRSVPSSEGLITLSGFLKGCSLVFIFVTTILLFKTETEEKQSEILDVKDTFIRLWHIMCLKNVLVFVSFLMTFQVALTVAESVSRLKFVEAGLQTENMALLDIPLAILGVFFPLYISHFTSGLKPLNLFLKLFPYKLVFNFIFAILVYWAFYVKLESGAFPTYYYGIVLLSFLLHEALMICISISVGSFMNKVSDPIIGGTYATLLNTFYNLGEAWPSTAALWLVDVFTFKKCDNASYYCDSIGKASKCIAAGFKCSTYLDGFYIESVGCVVFGFFWLKWGRKIVLKLHETVSSDWKISQHSKLRIMESGLLTK